jgi:F-type H+-transporting ATPase subunit epsilon
MATATGNLLRLRVVTPERTVVDRDVRSVTFMGEDGSYGILANHAPLMTPTVPGMVEVTNTDGSIENLLVTDGFAEIRNNVLSLICEEGERAEEIDLEAAIAAEKVAREKIAAMTRVDPTLPKAETALRVALLRQAIVRRRSGTGHI